MDLDEKVPMDPEDYVALLERAKGGRNQDWSEGRVVPVVTRRGKNPGTITDSNLQKYRDD